MHWTDSIKSGITETPSQTFHFLPKLRTATYAKAETRIVALELIKSSSLCDMHFSEQWIRNFPFSRNDMLWSNLLLADMSEISHTNASLTHSVASHNHFFKIQFNIRWDLSLDLSTFGLPVKILHAFRLPHVCYITRLSRCVWFYHAKIFYEGQKWWLCFKWNAVPLPAVSSLFRYNLITEFRNKLSLYYSRCSTPTALTIK